MFYCIIKLSKNFNILYRFCKSTSENSFITRMLKNSYVVMKLEPCIILKLFLNFSDFESDYSCKFILINKSVLLARGRSHQERSSEAR